MCDICKDAITTLTPAVSAALEKHPGSLVSSGPDAGQPVSRQHHVIVALQVLLRKLELEEQREELLMNMSLKNAA